jgi:hypothetical protein
MVNALIVRPRSDLLSPSRAGRAAQYVRMSTEHQRYSTQNQAAAIAVYAAQHDLVIVRTYAMKAGVALRATDLGRRCAPTRAGNRRVGSRRGDANRPRYFVPPETGAPKKRPRSSGFWLTGVAGFGRRQPVHAEGAAFERSWRQANKRAMAPFLNDMVERAVCSLSVNGARRKRSARCRSKQGH